MTVNDLIKAIAKRLKSVYPDRLIYVDEIPKAADGHHFIRCMEQKHETKLGRRRMRTYSFEVLHFKSAKDNMAFHDWAEKLYFEFEQLDVNGQVVHVSKAQAEPGDDMVFHFTFDVIVNGLIDPNSIEAMGSLKMIGGILP
ncbi:phage tail terminator family protein [Paenibacillus agilis]|uniref:Uncharacterized protein n=1 Tax=Paenibacillus agilis TaxID=3020863 RepID=A0A559IW84_9BACL|nr:hypothetical protein [Paenibacillus agilis]TVX91899.1 hypothetical protein FPZ44_01770 [Paenibacillus agilis]